ncbi:hypothetical protein EDB87DRAFT_1632614 [Lactarius vividus]|nr:hypothetical protein EDB87DRAFT_1632614 [Lactarius vividus]
MDVPPLDNSHPTTTESLRISSTSPDLATADAFVTPSIILLHPASASTFPLPSASSSTAVAFQHNADPLVPSDPPIPQFSALSNPVFDNTLPSESHRSSIVTTSPGNRLRPAPVPNPGATTEDDGSPKPGSHKESDAHDPPLRNQRKYYGPRSPTSMALVTDSDVAIAGPSLRGPNTERTGNHVPHLSHRPYDIV